MNNQKVVFAQKIIGKERKEIAGIIAKTLEAHSNYEGMPSTAYSAAGWRIEKNSIVRSPQLHIENLGSIKVVLEALNTSGLTAEGDLSVILSTEPHTGATLCNLCNLIASKDKLLGKALSRQTGAIPAELVQALNEAPIDTVEDFLRVYNSGIESRKYSNCGELWFEHIPTPLSAIYPSNYRKQWVFDLILVTTNQFLPIYQSF